MLKKRGGQQIQIGMLYKFHHASLTYIIEKLQFGNKLRPETGINIRKLVENDKVMGLRTVSNDIKIALFITKLVLFFGWVIPNKFCLHSISKVDYSKSTKNSSFIKI